MALQRIYCSGDDPQNTGYKKICANDLTAVVGFILLPKGETMTASQALTESTWITGTKAVAASRFYPFPQAESVTLIPKEAVYRDTPFEGSKLTANGLYGFEFMVDKHYSVIQRLRSHQGGQYEAVLIMQNGIIAMTSDDDTNLRGFSIQSLTIPQDNFSDGTTGHLAKVRLVLSDAEEWDVNGWASKPDDFNIKEIEGLYTVTLTASAPLGTGVTISVITKGAAATDPNAQWPGLAAADFRIETTGGVNKTITGIVDNGDGTYDLSATLAAGNYVAFLVAPASISVASYGIEADADATFTVV